MKISVMKDLLRIARAMLQVALDDVTEQMNAVHEMSENITGRYIPLLESWQGADADAFRSEILREVVPLIVSLGGAILGIRTGVENAASRIEEADRRCVSHVDDLSGQFRSII
ncbi:MAG: hypothetical protein H6672_16715 [Anaerolineaceae bacterium]|nr:hypothetical protein [Anaerolineaceae bacterium]